MTSPLISAPELRTVLASSPRGRVSVLDVRHRLGGPPGFEEFARGHLPGAAYVDLDRDLADPPGAGGRHPLPTPERFEAAMSAAGVSTDRPVVVYDDWSGRAAARCWWLLRYFGHPDVRVLDGGWSVWEADGGGVETGAGFTGRPGKLALEPGQLPTLEAENVLDFAGRGLLLDARDRQRYAGAVEPLDPVAGHIPGAVNMPTGRNLTKRGTFRDDLAEVYPDADEVAVYCGSGVTATHDILALASIGRPAALYAGSWSGWISDPARPVATGDRPG
ncbi:MAG: sulfurtransferase [Actinomycetota bacterium]|nr:sulfurtransferase [Actinomycetota bacterium]